MAEEKKKEAIVLKTANLYTGRQVKIVISDKSSVSSGMHVIANVLGPDDIILGHGDLTKREKAETLIILIEYLNGQHPDGKWTLMLSGPGMTTRPTFHIHGTLPEAPGQTLRFVFNSGAFLRDLTKEIGLLISRGVHSSNLKGFKKLAQKLEKNLK